MANSQMYGKYFQIHSESLKQHINDIIQKYGDKANTLKHILSTENDKKSYSLTYSLAKKIKHFFDNNSEKEQPEQYELYGGNEMKNFINKSLSNERNTIHRTKSVKSNIGGFENQFIKPHEKTFLKPTKDLKADKKGMEKIDLLEWVIQTDNTKPEIHLNASVAVLINNDKKILILKRNSFCPWEPDKYALVGGKQEENEDSIQTVLREIYEETNLIVDSLQYSYEKVEGEYTVSFFFGIVKNIENILLSPEHTEYKWCTGKEIEELDTVPDLLNDISKVFYNIYSDKVSKNLSI